MNAPAGTISLAQAARLLLISNERVRQLSKAGYFAPVAHGRYNLVAVVQGYFKYRDERTKKAQEAMDSPLSRAKLATIERRMAREDREIIAMDEALECFDIMADEYVKSIERTPAQITTDPAERKRVDAIAGNIVGRMKANFAGIRHRLVTGQDEVAADGGVEW